MSVLLFFTAEPGPGWVGYTTVSFIIGGLTSILAGYIGMRVAVHTNVRTTKECATSIGHGFIVAFRGGEVLGFTLVGLALIVLAFIIVIFKAIRQPSLTKFEEYR
jgi:H+-translocating diphosphatase